MDAKALPGNDSRYVQLKLSLKEVPDILLDHFGAEDKYTLNHLCLVFPDALWVCVFSSCSLN